MLRIGLTGELGSGKSTVARLLAARGAVVLSSDEMGRAMMQPGEPVFRAILDQFGLLVLSTDGTLNRRKLADIAFNPEHPRVEELNAIVHPAVLAAQEQRIAELAKSQPNAIVVIESALILTAKHAGGEEPWRNRFDHIVLVTAPDNIKIRRFLQRTASDHALTAADQRSLRTDAGQRLAAQRIPASLASECIVLENDGGMEALQKKTDRLWERLKILTKPETENSTTRHS